MKKELVKEKLLKAAMALLAEAEVPEEVTVRQIAARAEVNPAMISYCFGSKDELLKSGVDRLIANMAEDPFGPGDAEKPAIDRLWDMLWKLCKLVRKFGNFTRMAVPYILLQADIEAPLYILPLLREHFGGSRSETEIRVLAYEMLSFMQLVFYRAEDFAKYAGLGLDEDGAERLMKMQFRLLFDDGR